MLCPKCKGYSPYNTSVCNRCGAKLTESKESSSSRRIPGRQFYRNARPSSWQQQRSRMTSRANDALDGILADRKKKTVLLAAAALAVLCVVGLVLGCTGCICSSCGQNPPPSPVISEQLPPLPPADNVSGGDVPSGSDRDVTSPSDGSEEKIIIFC